MCIMKRIIPIFMFFIFISMFVYVSFADDIDNETIDVSTELNSFTDTSAETIKEPDVNSRACVVIDRKTNSVLFGKNENSKKKMASTTKIMTATIIIEKCNLSDTIEISKKAAGTGGSRLGLKTGDKIRVYAVDGTAVMIEILGHENNPYFIDMAQLKSITDYK